MILIDSNVPMYLVGAEHPNKIRAEQLLERAIVASERLVTDAEVLQEILHRYVAIGRREAIQPAFDAVLQLVDDVFAIELDDVTRAKVIVAERARLSARDAIHVAVMERRGIAQIMSFDSGFDSLPGIARLS